ncbi:MAG: sterol desaturase family protein [Chitinophagales bacterium]|nr:sterol desaturase family protein [Chitinophagales bacterium]
MDFSTSKISFAEMLGNYNAAPNLLLYASPLMLLFVGLEFRYSKRKNLTLYSAQDLKASVGVGIGYLAVTAAIGILTIHTVWWVYYYLTPSALLMPVTWWSFILCAIAYDFVRYWGHRIAHEQRFWWASHITHHSSEKYNLTVSFRLCWVDQVKLVFFIPMLMLGFDPIQFFIVHQIGILYQFWQHTELIKPMPAWIEYIFVTPHNHCVHHGKNEVYIDKNYGSLFIFWDRMFGTYVEPSEKPNYGVKQPIKSRNPVYLVFHEYVDIFRDMLAAKTWKDRYKAFFGRPGSYQGVEKF